MKRKNEKEKGNPEKKSKLCMCLQEGKDFE